MTQTLWIARHGNRQDFVDPHWPQSAQRPYDPGLSPDGVVQAQELAQRLAGEKIAHIFASPFLRTVETAHQVAAVLNLPIKIEPGLGEWLDSGFPSMPETLSMPALAQRFPEIDLSYTPHVLLQHPESPQALRERVSKTLQYLSATFPEDILIVSHGSPILNMAKGLVGESTEVHASLCCLVKLVRQGPAWRMELNGDTTHLSQSETVVRFN